MSVERQHLRNAILRAAMVTGTPSFAGLAGEAAPRERDLRTGGAWTPLQRAKNDAIWVLACVALAFARLLPTSALRRVGGALGLAAHTFVGRARQTARANVALVFPGLPPSEQKALVRRSFVTMGAHLGETVALLRRTGAPRLPLEADARTTIERALAGGRGVVFVSAHLGPWERVAASLVASGLPLVTVARESYDPRFTRVYERLRRAGGVGVVWRAGPAAALRMARCLRRGGLLGVPMDLRTRVPSCDVPFLGHAAPTAVGPARLALRTGAAVVVGTALPSADGRGLVVTATHVQTDDLARTCASWLAPGDRVAEDVRTLTTRINDELSRRISAWPEGWVWMHERWPARVRIDADKRV